MEQSRRIFYFLIALSLIVAILFSVLVGLILLVLAVIYYFWMVRHKTVQSDVGGTSTLPKGDDGGSGSST